MRATNAYYLLTAYLAVSASAQTIVQTFETGEDTSNWGADWVAQGGFDANAPGFLDPSLGGNNAASASTQFGQEASRNFRNNTAGVDVAATDYDISLYLQIDPNPGGAPASGNFYVLDGAFGDYTANLRLIYNAGNLVALEARDNDSWEALDVDLAVGDPYFIEFTIDPIAATYSTTVSRVNALGVVQDSATLTGLGITGNAINNHNNGQLFFHADSSAGFVNYEVDNIRVRNNVPEPTSMALALMGSAVLVAIKQRRRPAGGN